MTPKKCILVSIVDDISELKNLAEAIDIDVVKIFIQHKTRPDPKYFIGKGKANEIRDFLKDNDIVFVIFNSSLKPSQQYTLENYLGITVYDRIRLILEIFSNRAHSEEARLQVELAKLQYEVPLLRDWIHKARYGEKPGFMAGGEYEVTQYYEISKKRIKIIKNKLKKVEKVRELRRKHRKYFGYYLISIVGYTNAGKSTLFNLLAGETVKVENKLFTTLSTTTRKVPNLKKPLILTDTVGLLDNLPHWLIEAFHSTLEEIFVSDIILLIIDVSEESYEMNRKLRTGFKVLLPEVKPANIIIILNKIDRIVHNIGDIDNDNEMSTTDECKYEMNNGTVKTSFNIELEYDVNDIIPISALDNKYRDQVIQSILKAISYPTELKIILPNKSESHSFIGWLHTNSEILSIEYKENIKVYLRCREKDEKFINHRSFKLNGKVV